LELEREYIERTDFSTTRRGYDPAEVERHLREIAGAIEELKRSRASRPADSTASASAEQVRIIVAAAEKSAAQIEQEVKW
jgi:DivIVA domain-containing protein